jgi:translation initiation factor IF-3
VIDVEGQQLGVMPPQDALRKAEEESLDLVEVSPNAKPPVCRIMDYGKYKYQQSKKAQESKQKRVHSVITTKEIKLRPRTEEHDLSYKVRNMREFLTNRNKIKVSLQFRGREIAYMAAAKKIMEGIVEQVKDLGTVEQDPKLEGRLMTMIIVPKA